MVSNGVRMWIPPMPELGVFHIVHGPTRKTKKAAIEDLNGARKCGSRQEMLEFVHALHTSDAPATSAGAHAAGAEDQPAATSTDTRLNQESEEEHASATSGNRTLPTQRPRHNKTIKPSECPNKRARMCGSRQENSEAKRSE